MLFVLIGFSVSASASMLYPSLNNHLAIKQAIYLAKNNLVDWDYELSKMNKNPLFGIDKLGCFLLRQPRMQRDLELFYVCQINFLQVTHSELLIDEMGKYIGYPFAKNESYQINDLENERE